MQLYLEPLDAVGLASALEEEEPGPEDTSLAEAVEAILAIDKIMNDLRTNALGDQSGQAFGKALESNTTLTIL